MQLESELINSQKFSFIQATLDWIAKCNNIMLKKLQIKQNIK